MNWNSTFALYGNDGNEVIKSLGITKNGFKYLPTPSVVKVNDFQSELYKKLADAGLIGRVTDSGRGKNNKNVEVYQRGDERTYIVRLNSPITVPIKTKQGILSRELDTFFVKYWTRSKELAQREFDYLVKVDSEGIQKPTTIPVAIVNTPEGLQLIKIREPVVTYNDLPSIIKNNSDKLKIYADVSKQGFMNWGNFAALGLYQTDIIPLDHHGGEIWVHDNGLNGAPGVMSGSLEGPSNLGIVKEDGKEHCIVRDLEHVLSMDEIYRINLPHGEPAYGDIFSSRIGSTLGSLIVMMTRIGALVGVKGTDTLNEAMMSGYRCQYGRDRADDFDILNEVLRDVKHHINSGSMSTQALASVIDQFIVPEYVRVAFEIIEGSFGSRSKRRKSFNLSNREAFFDYFTRAYELNWDIGDQLMDTVTEICLSEDGHSVIPREHVNYVIEQLINNQPRKALKLAEELQENEPKSIAEIDKILKNDRHK